MFAKKSVRDPRTAGVCESLEDRRLLSQLTGVPIGTSGSYRGHGTVAGNALDGNFNTYFDGPDATGDWVGLNLGTPAVITQIQYAPRATLEYRMVGGVFQGSSTPDFSSGVVNLFTVAATPTAGVFTSAAISSTTAFQYVRYLGPSMAYCDVAELQFDGTPVTTTGNTLPLTPTGTPGSYANDGTTFANAFDGNLNTYFDGPTANGNFVGAIFSSEAILNQISYAPRPSYGFRMVGGIFQGSNSPTFTAGVANLLTITAAPANGVFTNVPISTTAAYEYVRYISPAGSYGDIGELTFSGKLTGIQPPTATSPSVTTSSPANGAASVSTTAFVSCALNLPNATGVEPGTLTASTVYLYRTFDHSIIPTEVNTDAVGSVIVLQPQSPLAANTQYTFVVTTGVTDNSGAAFTPFTMSFTTGAQAAPTNPQIAFSKTALPTAVGQLFSGITIGPDGNLYATTLTGGIFQFLVNADGSLGNPVNIASLANMPNRLITGIAFDPSSTASRMIIWISSGNAAENNAPDFSGSIGSITITNTATGLSVSPYQDYVVALPRSNSNHLNNQPVFGPDGALYWGEGSNSSMGAADPVWGYRPEHMLNAAILRLNIQLVEQYVAANGKPLNVQTDSLPAGQAGYSPYAAGAPLTIYATGLRNTYDLIWDNNGHLYAPTNGAAAGGNIPATPPGVTPAAPALNGVGQAEDDYLYDVQQGGYYGHPDPARGQYIYAGGNPINPAHNTEILDTYPLGTNPDPNYRGYAYDFGVHYSPDGATEYTGNAFGGALNGALLITEYSGGKDVLVLRTGSSGQITTSEIGIAGFTGFSDPVDITEDKANGDLYVADLGTESIMLLTPVASGAKISVSTSTLYFNAAQNGSASPTESITITNNGTQPLAIPATGLSVAGTDGSLFPFSSEPALPAMIAPGASITVGLVFNPGSNAPGLHTASLQISSNDPSNPLVTINLRALTTGSGVNSTPSLQAILNLYQIPDNVGTANANQSYFTVPPQTPNDEVIMPELAKAGPGPVTITPLAAFDANITPTAGFGYYSAGTPDSRSSLFTLGSASSQTVAPLVAGSTSFDPGSGAFAIYASFDAILNSATYTARITYSEDSLNSYGGANQDLVRFYPLKNSNGSLVPNAFVFAIDDDGMVPLYGYTNLVGIIRNVSAAPGPPVIGTQNVAGGDTEAAPSPGRLVLSAIGDMPALEHSGTDLRIDNTGLLPLVISSISSSNPFFHAAVGAYPVTIAVGSSYDLSVIYSPAHTGNTALDSGVLTINSNDPAHPALPVQLAGIWKSGPTPTLAQIVSTFGYASPSHETSSAYWTAADTNLPVTVEQLAAYSGKSAGSSLYWFSKASNSFNSILSIPGDDTLSLLPLNNDTADTPAFAAFTATGNFGFNIDRAESSDDSLNSHGSPTDTGHHVKFYAVYTAAGALIPNTWLMAMSYTASTAVYGYTDNVYLITNIRPAAPGVPTNAAATGSVSGITFSWKASNAPLLTGYAVYRSTASAGPYTDLTPTPITATSYLDTSATPGVKYYYITAAVDSFGSLSTFTPGVSATRIKNTSPPPVPTSVTAVPGSSSIKLAWTADTAADLAGYYIYRSNSPTGTFFKLNASPVTTASFTDSSSPAGVTSYYHVTAVNLSGVESSASAVAIAVSPAVKKNVVSSVFF